MLPTPLFIELQWRIATNVNASLQAPAPAGGYVIYTDEARVSASTMHSETSDEQTERRRMDTTPAEAFGAVVRVTGVAMRDRLALLRTGDAGTTLGVHAGRVQTLQRIHP
jgi:hypothetical protein